MKRSTTLRLAFAVACLAVAPGLAQRQASTLKPPRGALTTTYREPLSDGLARTNARSRPTLPGTLLPRFHSGPATMERVSTAAPGFAATSTFSLAARSTVTANAAPVPSYRRYRPGMPMPEP
jgi:hypothetical protein